jgi:UDP-N-acetylglucosamine 2-epimerase (non-hydrolysing)
VHTGQHYDEALSESFFADLRIPPPDVNLAVGSLSHAAQTARVMERLEPVLEREMPDWLIVYGDVNSTAAAALVAAKLGIKIAHVEAGLRSFDRRMPEEINRIVTDRLASLLLTPSRDADVLLRSEGEPDSEIVFVGNVMIDTLYASLDAARATRFRESLFLEENPVVVTLHRPSNVDDPDRMRVIAAALAQIAEERPVLFPLHPRTAQRLEGSGFSLGAVRVIQPLRYLEMLSVLEGAHAAVTDSGGVQEETTALGVPCFTVRENTERPITISEGTNRLVNDLAQLPGMVREARHATSTRRPDGWDGRAAVRIVEALAARATA